MQVVSAFRVLTAAGRCAVMKIRRIVSGIYRPPPESAQFPWQTLESRPGRARRSPPKQTSTAAGHYYYSEAWDGGIEGDGRGECGGEVELARQSPSIRHDELHRESEESFLHQA